MCFGKTARGGIVKVSGEFSKTRVEKSCVTMCVVTMLMLFLACQTLTPQQRALKQLAIARKDAKDGKNSQAIIEYRKALESDPKLAIAHFELGQLYLGNKDLLSGFRQVSMAVQLDGSNVEARMLLGNMFLAGQKYRSEEHTSELQSHVNLV